MAVQHWDQATIEMVNLESPETEDRDPQTQKR